MPVCCVRRSREASLVADELQEVAVRVSSVEGGAGGAAEAAAAVAWHRAGDDVRAGARQEPGGGFDTAVPDEAEVAATGYGGRAAQSEVWVLPDRGRVHVY